MVSFWLVFSEFRSESDCSVFLICLGYYGLRECLFPDETMAVCEVMLSHASKH